MARTQAADFDKRREAIMTTAATLYAEKGFLGASVAEIASACQTSKSLIYHYYPSKEDILFEVMDSHVQDLIEVAREVEAGPGNAAGKIQQVASALMQLYVGAEARHKVLLNELGNLPARRRATIVAHQRELLDIVERLLLALRPDLADDKPRRRVLVMMFFGMLNWTHTWYDPSGRIKSPEVAAMAADIFLAGVKKSLLF